MGLDIRIRKIRPKHFNSSEPFEKMFYSHNSKFVAEFRNVWSLLEVFTLSKDEEEKGRAYRFVTINRINSLNGGNETERLKSLVKTFDFDKFIYMVEFDF